MTRRRRQRQPVTFRAKQEPIRRRTHPVKLSNMRVRASYRRLYERDMPLEELVRRLRRLPKVPALLTLARIEALIERAEGDYPRVAAGIMEDLPDCTLKRCYYRAYAEKDEVLPFDRLQILNAERIILTDPTDRPGESDLMDLTNSELEQLLMCLFALNDYITEQEFPTLDIGDLAPALARNMVFYATEDLAHLLGRYYQLYFSLPRELSSHNCHMDLAVAFHKATSMDLEVFLAVAFGLAAAILVGKRDVWNAPAQYFARTKLTDKHVQHVLTKISRAPHEFRKALGDLDLKSFQPFNPYEVLTFRETPLLRTGDGLVFPLSTRFLIERATQGVFWDIADGVQGNRFFIFWGQLLEEYCWRLFENWGSAQPSLRGLYRDKKYRRDKSDVASSDLMFLYDDALVLVEVNAGRFRLVTKEGGRQVDYEDDLRKSVLKGGIGQLSRVADDYRKGLIENLPKVDRVVPVLVRLEAFPWNAMCVRHIRELSVRERYCTQEFADEWVIIDVEELERIAALGCQGISFLRIVDEWQTSAHFWHQPLKNYLLYRFRGQNMEPSLVLDGRKRMMQLIESRLCGQEPVEWEHGQDE